MISRLLRLVSTIVESPVVVVVTNEPNYSTDETVCTLQSVLLLLLPLLLLLANRKRVFCVKFTLGRDVEHVEHFHRTDGLSAVLVTVFS